MIERKNDRKKEWKKERKKERKKIFVSSQITIMRIVKWGEISSAPHPPFEQIVVILSSSSSFSADSIVVGVIVVVVIDVAVVFVAVDQSGYLLLFLRRMLLEEISRCRDHWSSTWVEEGGTDVDDEWLNYKGRISIIINVQITIIIVINSPTSSINIIMHALLNHNHHNHYPIIIFSLSIVDSNDSPAATMR